jgi:bifunctional enzyme CysN/CysC
MTSVSRAERVAAKHHRPMLVWFTGLSGAGKSTLSGLVDRQLLALGVHTYALDGDDVRRGLSKDLGFSAHDREENIRRCGEVAALMVDAGLVVLASFISPYAADRQLVRGLVADGEFVEVFVDVPLAEAERRDPKGLYARARRGELIDFTGIDAPYEAPTAPDVHLRTATATAQDCADRVVAHLLAHGLLHVTT